MPQTFYPRTYASGLSPSTVRMTPISGSNANATGANSLALGHITNAATGAQILQSCTAGATQVFGQWCTPYLDPQAVSPGNYTMGFVLDAPGGVIGNHNVRVGVYLFGVNNVFKANIVDGALGVQLGITRATATNTTAFSVAIAGLAFNPVAQDYVVWEVGVSVANSGPSDLAYNGQTVISADNAAGVTNSLSFITFPQNLLFYTGGGIVLPSADPPGWPFPTIVVGGRV